MDGAGDFFIQMILLSMSLISKLSLEKANHFFPRSFNDAPI